MRKAHINETAKPWHCQPAQLCIFYAFKQSSNCQNELQQTPEYQKETVIAVAIQPCYSRGTEP